jgi:hypothetical protein
MYDPTEVSKLEERRGLSQTVQDLTTHISQRAFDSGWRGGESQIRPDDILNVDPLAPFHWMWGLMVGGGKYTGIAIFIYTIFKLSTWMLGFAVRLFTLPHNPYMTCLRTVLSACIPSFETLFKQQYERAQQDDDRDPPSIPGMTTPSHHPTNHDGSFDQRGCQSAPTTPFRSRHVSLSSKADQPQATHPNGDLTHPTVFTLVNPVPHSILRQSLSTKERMVKNLRASLNALEQSELPDPTITMNPNFKMKPFGLLPSAPTYLTILQDLSLLQEDLDSNDHSDPKVVTLMAEISTTQDSVLSAYNPNQLNLSDLFSMVTHLKRQRQLISPSTTPSGNPYEDCGDVTHPPRRNS